MKEIYDWVPWFQELARKIEKIEKGEKADLTEKANKVDWRGKRLVDIYGNADIDPFSFFYFLASKNSANHLKPVYDSVSNVFEIKNKLPDMGRDAYYDDYYIFPSPDSRYNNFYNKKNFESDLLWNLFSGAVKNDLEIDPDDFENALKINGVGVARLTQTLFLINPKYFLPVDKTYYLADALGLPVLSKIENEIKKAGGYEVYRSVLKKLREAFPECQPHEINMFLYLQESEKIINADSKFFQISTYVYNNGKDYWKAFKDNNWVYTGSGNYPLSEPKRGDIILVRTGYKRGRAIGIVLKNDYELGYKEDHKIHVLWINKSEKRILGTDGQGFNQAPATNQTYKNFEKSYKPSFDLINSLTGNSSENDDPQPKANTMKYPLNQILYGPPGTGKTYNTINHAVAIIEDKPLGEIENEDRKEVKQRFDKLKEEGQIEMVTFHQNFTYEDFIEGIRPVLTGENQNIEYELSEGVFRKIADRANKNRIQSEQTGDESWDMDELLQVFAESIEERLESGEEINLSPPDVRSGATIIKVNRSADGNFKSVLLGGSVTSPHLLNADVIKQKYDAFYKGEITKQEDIKGKTGNRQGLATYYFPLFQKIKQFHDEEWQSEESVPVNKQNYVLIIDEINRGNIAKIFGELITLIESSKRIGGNDEATATLPYSQDFFGVPDNLYIIGTMNTADRSIALLDTALRRRFVFIEMMPDSKYVSDNIDGVDCQKLLNVMNDRIRFLFDREHQIGHTYFMDVDDMESLAATFKNKIIPLLQEYFYDNWEKIYLVLNGNEFIVPSETPIDNNLFRDSDLIDRERKIYELSDYDEKWKDPKSYQTIYDKGQDGTGGTE